MKDVSGKIGNNFVVKNYPGGGGVLQNKPKKPKKRSKKQKKHSNSFWYSIQYANNQMAKPAVLAVYEWRAKGTARNAQNLMVRDHARPPIICAIEVENYTGASGEIIRIRAIDDFKVKSVSVTITGKNNKIIEKGEAALRGKKGLWRYFTTVTNPNPVGTIITALAMDLPENKTTASLTCSNVPGEQKWVLDANDPNGSKKLKEWRKKGYK